MLMRRLICATDTPNIAGPMSCRMRLTPASRQSRRGRGSMPMRASAGIWKASCSAPPAKTAHASTIAGGSK